MVCANSRAIGNQYFVIAEAKKPCRNLYSFCFLDNVSLSQQQRHHKILRTQNFMKDTSAPNVCWAISSVKSHFAGQCLTQAPTKTCCVFLDGKVLTGTDNVLQIRHLWVSDKSWSIFLLSALALLTPTCKHKYKL